MRSSTTKQIPLLFGHSKGNGLQSVTPSMILDKWNELINAKLNPLDIDGELFTSEAVQLIISESENDQQTIRAMLIEDLTGNSNISDKELYVKLNQGFLIRMLDTVFSYRKATPASQNIARLHDAISQHLQGTLDFIENFFGNYFDRNEKVPEPYFRIAREDLKKQLKRIKNAVSQQGNIDTALIDIISESFNHLLGNEIIAISYSRLTYFKTLLNELHMQKTLQSTKAIIDALHYMNFNEDNFIAYEYEWLKHITDHLATNKDKVIALRFEQKNINQLPLKLNCCYNPNMPPLREQINGWIDEETKYLDNLQTPEKAEGKISEHDDKIHTSLSVAKLALIIRLLVIDKIIINRTVAPMLRIAAKIFTTLQREEISFGSLETKYHAPDKATVNAVRDMLFKWINILGKL
jgi:hypothetical protein